MEPFDWLINYPRQMKTCCVLQDQTSLREANLLFHLETSCMCYVYIFRAIGLVVNCLCCLLLLVNFHVQTFVWECNLQERGTALKPNRLNICSVIYAIYSQASKSRKSFLFIINNAGIISNNDLCTSSNSWL